MAEKIIAAFQSGKPLKISGMSWQDFLTMLKELNDFRQLGETQAGKSQ
ncbi:hypothetical protein [Vibrio cholerae]|nr:hypothetical protein [Vibrio cholerae]